MKQKQPGEILSEVSWYGEQKYRNADHKCIWILYLRNCDKKY